MDSTGGMTVLTSGLHKHNTHVHVHMHTHTHTYTHTHSLTYTQTSISFMNKEMKPSSELLEEYITFLMYKAHAFLHT